MEINAQEMLHEAGPLVNSSTRSLARDVWFRCSHILCG